MLEFFQNLTLGKKLQAINLLIVGLFTLMITINLGFYMLGSLLDDYEKKASTLSRVLTENLNSALLFNDVKATQDVLNSLGSVPDVVHATIYDKSGHMFASYASANNPVELPPEFDQSLFEQRARLGQPLQGFAMPIMSAALDGEQIGTITMHLDLSEAYRVLYRQIGVMLLGGLVILIAVSTLLTKLQEVITQPLLNLTDVMRKVGKEGDLSARADISSRDEIGEMAGVFNEMVEKLSHRENSLQIELNERRHIEEKLSEIAHFDPITNLPNRHSFDNQIARVLLNYKYDLQEFALMYIDLDNFKYVNDTFGHHLGDLLLSRIAERMRKSLRQGDFVARLGGDEFAIIMSDFSDNSQIREVAEKLLAAMKTPFTLEGREVFIGASIGISICPANGNDSESLKRQADSAMYLAKNRGKNNYQFYQDELSRTQQNRINIETSLRRSLERNEIVVYYQPIVEIAGEQIIGFEALARWIREDGVVVRPDEFIPLAEEIGLIIDIGKFILDTAAAQTAEWVERYGLSFTSVNFSSRQFKQTDLASEIFDILKNAHLHPKNFEMEITESILMDSSLDSLNLLELLIQQGMGISIDDFGTGYSSLSYITSFPISKIKIDQSFVAKLPSDKNALAVVTAIIGLAKSLNLKVVAEGIETSEQLACLARLGCQYGQGFLFSKPLPAIEAARLLVSSGVRSA
ncbi:MAG: bifunctional diguanylate cyclase/phosphodiesterase [Pseudomonadota bacterium]